MILQTLFLGLAAAPAAAQQPSTLPGLFAIRVGRAETIAKGTLQHAVILVEGGKIVKIGEDLPVAKGIPVLDRPEWVVMPGLVNAYSRLGLEGEAGEEFNPDVKASSELYADSDELKAVVKYGVTTLGLYPPGNGICGQAVAIRPLGASNADLVLADSCYLKVVLRATSSSKKALQDGFKKADDYAEKEKKAREKWDKEQEKKKAKPAKKEEPKPEEGKGGDEKKEEPKPEEKKEAGSDAYVPPEADAKTQPFLDLRSGKLHALVSLQSAAEYLHFLDAIGKEGFAWDLRLPLQRESDLFYVLDKKTYDLDVDGIGDKKVRCVLEPVLTVQPGTMRTRNLAMELAHAGAKIVFVPRSEMFPDHKNWLANVGEVVNAGLDRDTALRALTLEPAAVLGVDKRLGSLEKDKDANMLFFNGDPLEPASKLQAVMLEGRIVFGEVKL
jgi:Amidohydrolase family